MLDTPHLVRTGEQPAAVVRLTVSRAEISHVMGLAIAEVLAAITAQGATPVGPCFTYHLKRPSDRFDFAVGFPVDKPITSVGRVTMGQLPAADIARTVYTGGYAGLAAAWAEFCAWIETEELTPQDSLWECYLSGPESNPDPATWRTELNRPLAG